MSKKLTYLIIHCTATPEGREVSAADIRRMHTSPVSQGGRGWKQVGYSDIIHLDGTVENLVPYNENDVVDPWEITNGATGMNSISRHVVYAGGMSRDMKRPKDTRTDAQRAAMLNYVKAMIQKHPDIKIAGHSNFANKACPSFNVAAWAKENGIPKENIYWG